MSATDTAPVETNPDYGLPVEEKLALASARYRALDNRRYTLKMQIKYPDPTNPNEVNNAQQATYDSLVATLGELDSEIQSLKGNN